MRKKRNRLAVVFLAASLVFLNAPAGFAKKEGGPAGWAKGEKKGWKGESTPPGFAKRDAKKAEAEARKQAKQAEKDAKKKAKEAERESRKKAKEAEKEARRKAKEAEKAAALTS